MPELPDRPNLDQLRHQARELLRAAADGEPAAQTRLRAVSERVSLSAAQLAVAREHGFASWPALRAGVDRRLAELHPHEEGAGRAGTRWSFGAGAALETEAGVLYPGILTAAEHQATLDAQLAPPGQTQRQPTASPAQEGSRETWGMGNEGGMRALGQAIVDAVTLIDDQETRYSLRIVGMSGLSPVHLGHERRLMSVRLRVDPVPALDRGWLELRGRDRSAARLQRFPHPAVRVSRLAPVADSPAARELADQARWLIICAPYLAGGSTVPTGGVNGPSCRSMPKTTSEAGTWTSLAAVPRRVTLRKSSLVSGQDSTRAPAS